MAYDPSKYWFQGKPFTPVTNYFDTSGQKYWFQGTVYSPLTDSNRFAMSPSADSSDGLWTNNASGSELFSVLDEDPFSDTDYIQSSANPVNDTCKIKLAVPSYTVDQPLVVSYRFGKSGDTASCILTIRLLQGTTEIASWTENSFTDAYVQRERAVSPAQFALITDFNDLYIEFKANTA